MIIKIVIVFYYPLIYIYFYIFVYILLEKSLVTVWSAPNYCYRCGNVASVLALDENLGREFKMFNDVPDANDSVEVQRKNLIPYFM